MEKILIKNKADFEKAIKFFGKKYQQDISKNVKECPFFLIGNYSEDIEFGTGYSFTSVSWSDFKEDEICKNLRLVNKFTPTELDNILRKVKEVKIKYDLKNILERLHFTILDSPEDVAFIEKYAGKQTHVYEWCGDWFICEDDNYVLDENCFFLLK